jgi:hypothetical protein
MSSFKLLGAALVVAAFVATPVSAQQAVQEPGAAAFYHPNADILHAGMADPSNAFAAMRGDDVAAAQMVVRSHKGNRLTVKHH